MRCHAIKRYKNHHSIGVGVLISLRVSASVYYMMDNARYCHARYLVRRQIINLHFIFDNFQIYDFQILFMGYCDYVLINGTSVMKTVSNVLFVRFVSDNIDTRAGFKLAYEQGLYHFIIYFIDDRKKNNILIMLFFLKNGYGTV